ncbi:MAG: hypothetical protein OET44_15350 [Gammaproteobacteria bacterium]|nr:hypothetical protein [Gammaproteobacteria bacterium]
MVAANRSPLRDTAASLLALLLCVAADSSSYTSAADFSAGYYSREQNDGELARASGTSQFIRFYESDRIVTELVPD